MNSKDIVILSLIGLLIFASFKVTDEVSEVYPDGFEDQLTEIEGGWKDEGQRRIARAYFLDLATIIDGGRFSSTNELSAFYVDGLAVINGVAVRDRSAEVSDHGRNIQKFLSAYTGVDGPEEGVESRELTSDEIKRLADACRYIATTAGYRG